MKQVLFYAMKADLLLLLDAVERKIQISYVTMGALSGAQPERFVRGAELPQLGVANAASAIACVSYLVSNSSQQARVRSICLADGSTRHVVDQLCNPDSIVFSPGGLWSNDVLLYGRVGTTSDVDDSQNLMKIFAMELRRNFKKVKTYWVGPEAFEMLKMGKRLTISTSSPVDFDLKLT